MAGRPRERVEAKVVKGRGARRAHGTASGATPAARSRRSVDRRAGGPAARREVRSVAAPREPSAPRRWSYRLGEHVLAAAVATVGALAALTPAMASSPGTFVAALGTTALGAAGVVLAVERVRRAASTRWRHVVNGVVLAAGVAIAVEMPPWTAVRELRGLMARERGTQLGVVAHQVYAAYRRMDREGQRRILERAEVYEPSIMEASRAFGLGHELLMGIAAAESSFHPRPSRDGGQGLFQITSVPRDAEERARAALGVDRLDSLNQKHNAFVAAATVAEYAKRMDGDLLLTLLAYNIGPHNGGLEFVMKQYGARNFAQIQPYLQALPRDYPIRVLAAALAYRIWRSFGDLPPLEEGEWAARIRELGVPGLDDEARRLAMGPG